MTLSADGTCTRAFTASKTNGRLSLGLNPTAADGLNTTSLRTARLQFWAAASAHGGGAGKGVCLGRVERKR